MDFVGAFCFICYDGFMIEVFLLSLLHFFFFFSFFFEIGFYASQCVSIVGVEELGV